MNQIVLQHFKNFCNFLSLEDFKIPFIVNNGLIFNEKLVYIDGLEKGIMINKKLNASNSSVAIEEGFWIYYDEYGQKISEGNYKNGNKEEYWICYDENSQKNSEENYKDGILEGFWIYYKNEQLNTIKQSEGNWKNGKQNGLWISYYENEKLNIMQHVSKKSEENFKDGQLDGIFIFYYENENQEEFFISLYENGNLKMNKKHCSKILEKNIFLYKK